MRKDDARAQNLRNLGAEIFLGDMSSLRDVRLATSGIQRAYFRCAVGAGLVEKAVIFAQAAKGQGLELIVDMSHKQSRPAARSKATQDHWLSEQLFEWSGGCCMLRRSFRYGRYIMPFDKDSRFAPIAAADTANIVEKPEPYIGKALQLHGPVEYSHEELAAEVGRVLNKNLVFEQVTVSVFLETLGIPGATDLRKHFEVVALDQQEGLIAGTDTIDREIIGGPVDDSRSIP